MFAHSFVVRKWRRHCSQKRELRKKKQIAADTALSSLSLGPSIRHYEEVKSLQVIFFYLVISYCYSLCCQVVRTNFFFYRTVPLVVMPVFILNIKIN